MDLNQTSYSIHIFGDSHSRIYSSPYLSNYICKVYYTGPITMHRIGRDKPTLAQLKEMSKTYYTEYLPKAKKEYQHMKYPASDEIKPNDIVIFVFGEIDIRNHIGENAKKANISLYESIKICVDRYMETILYLKNKMVNVGVYCPPASSVGWPTTYGYANVRVRNNMTLAFNNYLGEKCVENDIRFVNICKEMILPTGETDQKFIMDDIHLSQQAMPIILEKFKDYIHG